MNKKTEVQDYDIPKDDIECWERYPKHRWVYELSRLLDAQNIKWSPFKDEDLMDIELNMDMFSIKSIIQHPGYIYTRKIEGRHMLTEVYISKGEIKLLRHIDPKTGSILTTLIGEIELRLSAFITLYFQKFTGVITAETQANEIVRICLRPLNPINVETNQEVIKLIKRIYKKTDITISGLTDQVIQERLTS